MSLRHGQSLAMMGKLVFGATIIFLFWNDATCDRFRL